jgi:hypothetical protein
VPSGSASPATEQRRGRLRRAVASHLTSSDVARVIYGAIIGLALVVALEAHPPTAGQATVAVLGAAVAVGLAEIYSELIGTEARTRRPIERRQLRTAAGDALPVVFGAGFPAIFFALATAGVMDTAPAFTLSKWTGLGLICVYGFVAGRLSGSGIGGALLHAAAVGAIGGLLILLKALLH